jgi:hypothetical protein
LLSALRSTALSLLLLGFMSVSAQTTGNRNSPYSATKKVTFIQKLADGTTITRESTATEARDSQGRTVQTTTMTGIGGRSNTHTTVMDPVARTTTFWSSLSKQATMTHLPELRKATQLSATTTIGSGPTMVSAAGAGDFPIAAGPSDAVASTSDPHVKPARQIDRLGGKTIAGVYAEGVRTTITYPVGYMGNDRPIAVVREIWTAPDLKITLLATDNDPRTGLQSTEVTDVVRTEPDPTLFLPPEGYTIKDHTPGSN